MRAGPIANAKGFASLRRRAAGTRIVVAESAWGACHSPAQSPAEGTSGRLTDPIALGCHLGNGGELARNGSQRLGAQAEDGAHAHLLKDSCYFGGFVLVLD